MTGRRQRPRLRLRLRLAGGLAAAGLGTVFAGTVLASTAIAGALAVSAAPPAAAAASAAEPVGDCTTTSGVIVAVDFAHFGGPLLRSCGSTPTTGYTLLNQGGWQTTGTQHDGPGFVCRIGYSGYHGGTQYPTQSQEACVLTPPTSAYWAFWYASPGQASWSYSQTGAMAIKPEPGSVELWVFGGTNSGGTSGSAVPPVSPASLRAKNTGQLATVHHHSQQHHATAPAGQTTPAGQPTSSHPAGTATSSSPAAHGSGSTPSGRATIRDAQPRAASAPASHGSATPAIIALVIVLVLAAAGITAVLRRPRRER